MQQSNEQPSRHEFTLLPGSPCTKDITSAGQSVSISLSNPRDLGMVYLASSGFPLLQQNRNLIESVERRTCAYGNLEHEKVHCYDIVYYDSG